MTERNALEGVVDVALEVVSPLVAAASDEQELTALLAEMGWSAPAVDVAELGQAVTTLVDAVEGLRAGLAFESLEDLAATLESLAAAGTSLADFAAALAEAAGAAAADPAVVADVTAALAVDLLHHLTLLYIGRRPAAYAVLELLGLIEDRPVTAISTGGDQPLLARAPLRRPALALDALGGLLGDPPGHLKARLGVRQLTSEEAAREVLEDVFGPVLDLVVLVGGSGVVGHGGVEPDQPGAEDVAARRRATLVLPLPSLPVGGEPVTTWLSLTAELVPAGTSSTSGDAGPGVQLTPHGELQATVTLPGARLRLEVAGDIGSVYFPAGGTPVLHGGAEGVRVTVAFEKVPPQAGAPAFALGADTARLTISGLTAAATVRFARPEEPELYLQLDGAVERARFVLAPGEGDGFLSSVLPADGIAFEFGLGIGWSSRRGVYFSGAASLEAEFPLHVSLLGVLTIDVVHLGLAADEAGMDLAVGATATLTLGPLTATVQRLGLEAQTTFPAGGGNLGPLAVTAGFLAPRGVGLVIDAAAVQGGGFVLNDPERGRYAGILELDIAKVVSVTAIGLISTRMPDGSEGFSLLVIITATFPPIQLGFGFTLSGLGGILGLNRTMKLDALRDGARTGVLDSILFPVDPVARADKVISDVEAVFPVAGDRFTIGLMARLGWGSPQVVTVDLGIVLELPAPVRIALLGRLTLVLPDPDAAIVELHLDLIGILDLGRGELSVDATLHDSRIAVFEVYGDMALRVGWGASPAFAVSVGGFNPRFSPPAGFPALRRLTIALASGDNPRVRLESYLATTSNSFQVGARLDAHAELDAGFIGLFTADAYLGFDALIVLDPFQFIIDFGGGIVIKRNGAPFLGAELVLTLYGPQPLRATGYAEVHFFGTHRVPIEVTVGDEPPEHAVAAADPTDALVTAVSDPAAWTALPPDGAPMVALRETPAEELLAHPGGLLGVRQRVVPLGLTIERFGGAPLAGGPRSFTLSHTLGGAAAAAASPVRDAWAPGDLFTLSDDEKLSRPAFEQLVSGGIGIGAPATKFGTPVPGSPGVFETSVIDADDPLPRPVAAYTVPAGLDRVLQAGGAAAVAARSDPAEYLAPPQPVTLADPGYVLASTRTLQARGDRHHSWVEAEQEASRSGEPGLQVVGAHEAVAP